MRLATKAIETLRIGVNGEGWSAGIRVKRAKTDMAATNFPQLHRFTDDFNNIYAVFYIIYRVQNKFLSS
jgi:RecB family endonuclease NucS